MYIYLMKRIYYFILPGLFLSSVFGCKTTSVSSNPQKDEKIEQQARKNTSKEAKKCIAINNDIPMGNISTFDDFEEDTYWFAHGDAFSALPSEDWASSGTYSCMIEYRTKKNSSASISCTNLQTNDFTGTTSILADVYNPTSSSIEMWVELGIGENHDEVRTKKAVLGIGENMNVIFSLLHELTDAYGNPVSIENSADDIREISLKFTNGASPVYVDNIRLHKSY